LSLRKAGVKVEESKLTISIYKKENWKMKIQMLGGLNRDKLIYYIEAGNKVSGLGALWRRTIDHIYLADLIGAVPVVSWGDSFFLKGQKIADRDTDPFEYFFEPINEITLEEALASSMVLKGEAAYQSWTWGEGELQNVNGLTEKYVELLAKVVKKHNIYLKRDVRLSIDREIEILLQKKKTLGLHIRGGEQRMAIKGYCNPATPEQYFEVIDKVFEDEKFEQIFVATDDDDYLDLFRTRYGEKVIAFKDSKRGKKDVYMLFDDMDERENDGYWMGYEVLRDIFALLRCGAFIAGASNVTLMTCVYEKIFPHWDWFWYIDTGICQEGIDVREMFDLLNQGHGKYRS